MSPNLPAEALKHTEYANQSDVPFQKIEHLGRGAYGVVDKVQRGSKFYARKSFTIYKHRKRRILDDITNEIKLANSIKHIHAVSLVETYTCGLEYAMIMEPVADGNLAEFIHDMDDGSASRDLVSLIPGWFGCLLAGLAYLHGQHIHHRDIKPQNLLHYGQNILFADFGIARDFVEETCSEQTTVTGTRNYWAPESDNERRPGRKADVFSLGLVFLELIAVYSNTGSFSALQSLRPYSGHLTDVHSWITSVDMTPIEAEWYPTMIFVCRHMLRNNKEDRPYADALAACWEYQPFTAMPPTSCSCITSSVGHNVRGMHDARERARKNGHPFALELLLRRGSLFNWRGRDLYTPQILAFSEINEISTMPYEPPLIDELQTSLDEKLYPSLPSESSQKGIAKIAYAIEGGGPYGAALRAAEQENRMSRFSLEKVEVQLEAAKPFILNQFTLKNPTAIAGSMRGALDHVDDTFLTLHLPFPVSLFGFSMMSSCVTKNGVFCLGWSSRLHKYRPLPCRDIVSRYVLFPFWAELKIVRGRPSGIFYETLGEAPRRSLTIEWYLTRSKHEEQDLHFNINFQEERPNVVSFNYYKVPDQGSECTVGIQGPKTHNMFSYNQPKLVEGLQLVFDTVANTMVESVLHEPLRIDA